MSNSSERDWQPASSQVLDSKSHEKLTNKQSETSTAKSFKSNSSSQPHLLHSRSLPPADCHTLCHLHCSNRTRLARYPLSLHRSCLPLLTSSGRTLICDCLHSTRIALRTPSFSQTLSPPPFALPSHSPPFPPCLTSASWIRPSSSARTSYSLG